MEPRSPTHRYRDPLDRIWLTAAERIGFAVTRTPGAYASTDGRKVIELGTPETLDPDDCVAQMLLHEICHALVQGEEGEGKRDWGLDNETDRDVPREHACLRLQAALLRPWGLRALLGPMTDFRAFYDELPDDPLTPADDPTVMDAKIALQRARRGPWAPHLETALAATSAVAQAVASSVSGVTDEDGMPSLWILATAPAPLHPVGFPMAPGPAAGSCGDCAWRFTTRGVSRCRQAAGPAGARVEPAWPACERWEPALDCQTCGACCRAAYHSVEVSPRDPMVRRHPALVVAHRSYLEVRRDGDRCAALHGGRTPDERYACAIYEDRPRTCRDFTLGSAHCLDARRRVGLSR